MMKYFLTIFLVLGICNSVDATESFSNSNSDRYDLIEKLKSNTTNSPMLALICFKTGEQISGMNKICYYNCNGSQAAITIGSTSLCPLSIDR